MNTDSKTRKSGAGSFFRFCWLRETTPGHLEHDGGIRIARCDLLLALFGLHPAQQRTTAQPPVSLDRTLAYLSGDIPFEDFPMWARRRLVIMLGPMATEDMRRVARHNAAILMDVAQRIVAAVPAGAECEVHLPYIDRRAWNQRFATLEKTAFTFHQGRVIPTALMQATRLQEYDAQLLAVASVSTNMAAGLAFTDSRQVVSAVRDRLLPVPVKLNSPAGGSAQQVEVRLNLAPSVCRAWNSAPKEREASYFAVHAAVSIAAQAALRRWLAWHWLSDLANYEDTLGTYTVLAYLCSRPFPGRRRTDFTYDTLTVDWMPFAFRFARRPLRDLLKAIRAALLAAGKTELAQTYHQRNAKLILERIRKQRKAIRAVIAAEGSIVNYILRCGLELQGATDPIRAAHVAPQFVRGLAVRLRRLFQEQDLTALAPMLLLEATDAIAISQGAEPALTATATVAPVGQAPSPLRALSPPLLSPVPVRSQPAPSWP